MSLLVLRWAGYERLGISVVTGDTMASGEIVGGCARRGLR